jgi:hypothetical protein
LVGTGFGSIPILQPLRATRELKIWKLKLQYI